MPLVPGPDHVVAFQRAVAAKLRYWLDRDVECTAFCPRGVRKEVPGVNELYACVGCHANSKTHKLVARWFFIERVRQQFHFISIISNKEIVLIGIKNTSYTTTNTAH